VQDCTKYFESHGARTCGDEENIAEYALEVVGQPSSCKKSWGELWNGSDEYKKVQQEIDSIIKERSGRNQENDDPDVNRVYAASTMEQIRLLSLRMARNFYRDSSYGYSKLTNLLLVGIFNG
jgi:hypothetical protein